MMISVEVCVKHYVGGLLALILLLALGACQSTTNGATLQVSATNPQILRVGPDTYTLNDFAQRMETDIGPAIANMMLTGQTREQIEALANEQNARAGIFDSMVQELLLMQYARGHGIGIDPAQVDASFFSMTSPFDPQNPFANPSADRLMQAQQQLTLEVLARNTRADMFHARIMMLTSEADANQILADLQAGADFATLAKDRSKDLETAPKGGDMGWEPLGNLPPELDGAGFTLELNTPTKIQVGESWYVFEVLERQAGPNLEDKRAFENFNQLQQSMGAQQFYAETFIPWYDQLRAAAEASGDLEIADGFDPNSVPLPFPE
ncbi:foldase protein PrsA [Candidatus Oscillochloris fontis]|uniref:foldase protein PrsA n=1 Tax=Candidatus Oscillochloris fontis TaxID=2496868 RepID=UPI0013760062|nr:peptidylprolyl isomerase [Candidatus Oscillochloris fontis]